MNLSNEAAYLYVLSKEIEAINRQIARIAKKMDKHRKKYDEAKPHKKDKHKGKHNKARQELQLLLKEHNRILAQLKHHHTAFAGGLVKEHRI